MPHRPDCPCPTCHPRHPDPTPEQIAAECEKIQATWTPGERVSRIVDGPTHELASKPLTVPVIRKECGRRQKGLAESDG